MTKWVIAIVMSTLVMMPPQVARQIAQVELNEVVSDAEIGAAIRALDSQSLKHSLEVFYKNPEEATRLLIAELKPTKRGRYPGGTHPQAIWIIRALRSLTGLDFRAPTQARLSDDEAHFLRASAEGEVE